MTPLAAYLGLLGLLVAERGVELRVSARNARRLRARGAVEAGRGHYGPMVALHALFPLACALQAVAAPGPPALALALPALALAAGAQALRWWAVATLGERWTTRVLALPGAAPVTGGPYRLLRHPNYLAVVVELAAVPLVYGGWGTALAFSAANALLLRARVRAEEAALGPAWRAAFRPARAPAPGRRP